MRDNNLFELLANAVLCLHVLYATFVVLGLVLVVVGNLASWRWVNALWFRLAHLTAILVVVAEAWIGYVCPLTTLEMWLRTKAQTGIYTGSFIEHWAQRILFYSAPSWVFTMAYSLFALAVVATWWFFPPRTTRYTQAENK